MSANDMAEKLARRLRDIMGEFNDDCVGVEILVRQLADYRRAHLAQPAQSVDVAAKDAEIERLTRGNIGYAQENVNLIGREHIALKRAEFAESRLAAADALLRDIRDWDVAQALGPTREKTLFALPIKLRSRLAKHLQGAGDEA